MLKTILKNLRKENQLTQAELAYETGLPQSAISFWEKGEREPSLESLNKLAEFYQVSVSFLLGQEEKEINYVKKTPELSEDEKEILSMYRDLNDKYKTLLKTTCEIYLEQEDNITKQNNKNITKR